MDCVRLLRCLLVCALLLVCCQAKPTPTRAPTPLPSPSTVRIVTTLAGSGQVGGLGGGYQDGPSASALFRQPCALAMDAAGNVYVADMKNQRIRMIRPDGYVLTLAGSGPAGPMMGGYVDGPASAARFADPTGLCVAPDGSVYVADGDNHRIRRIAPDGQVSTLIGSGVWGHKDGSGQAAELAYPNRIALDEVGNLYVTEGHSRDMYERRSGNFVRKITRDGVVTTVAGSGKPDYADGPAITAHMDTPMGLDVDSAGNIYVADYLNHCIRVVTPDGYLHTLAGIARLQGYRDGAADSALFSYPMDVLVNESEGLLYVADVGNHRIRTIALP